MVMPHLQTRWKDITEHYAATGSSILPLTTIAGVTQLVERQPSKLEVAGSSPVARSNYFLFVIVLQFSGFLKE